MVSPVKGAMTTMDLIIWLPALFALGIISIAACLAFAEGCTDLKEVAMIYLTALITALLFIYLGTALVRPEWF
jgi:F subunit of K+-transporting ATPase (Potass_KdpF)